MTGGKPHMDGAGSSYAFGGPSASKMRVAAYRFRGGSKESDSQESKDDCPKDGSRLTELGPDT